MSKNCTCTPSPGGWHQNHCDMVGANEYERGIAEGERRERAAVVAWLRARAAGPVEPEEYTLLAALADRCEAGEHKEAT